jgi:hypothetical protein
MSKAVTKGDTKQRIMNAARLPVQDRGYSLSFRELGEGYLMMERPAFGSRSNRDGQNWKPLRPEDPLIKELRLLCRDEVGLIEQRTAFINQLRHALAEYYPTALETFED